MTDTTIQGGCQCGAVRYSIAGDPLFTAICHCTMCRRASAAPVVAWAMFQDSQVEYQSAKPHLYASSEDAKRGFCRECGTQISFTATFLPGLIDITVGSFDDPEALKPELHYWHSEHLSWVDFADGLPRHPELPPQE